MGDLFVISTTIHSSNYKEVSEDLPSIVEKLSRRVDALALGFANKESHIC